MTASSAMCGSSEGVMFRAAMGDFKADPGEPSGVSRRFTPTGG